MRIKNLVLAGALGLTVLGSGCGNPPEITNTEKDIRKRPAIEHVQSIDSPIFQLIDEDLYSARKKYLRKKVKVTGITVNHGSYSNKYKLIVHIGKGNNPRRVAMWLFDKYTEPTWSKHGHTVRGERIGYEMEFEGIIKYIDNKYTSGNLIDFHLIGAYPINN